MPLLEQAIKQYQRQPRAGQWVILAALVFGVFLIWDRAIAPTTANWKREADSIQMKLQQVRSGEELIRRFKALDDEIAGIGSVELPGGEAQGREAILSAINKILRGHSVAEESFSIMDGRVDRRTLSNVFGTKRLESLKVDLEYVATPEEAVAIISELEANPDIEFIRSIRMNQAPNQKIKVRLTFETWVLGSKARG